MFGTIPPIPPPFGTSSGNPGSPNVNRVDTMPATTDPINNMNTTNVSQSVVDENLPQLLDSRGGSHVINVPTFDKEDFTSWKVRFLVFLNRLETYLLKTLEDGPFVPMSSLSTSEHPLPKHQNQWSNTETHEGPSDIRDTKIAALRLKFNAFKSLEGEKVNGTFTRLKCLLNDLENNGVTIPQAEVNATFVNSLQRKWLSMNQTQRANNSIKNDSLDTLDSDVKEDQRTNNKFMADLNAKYHERALLENQKRFYKRSDRVGSARKPLDKTKETDYKGKYKGLKAKMAFLTKRIDDMTKGKSENVKKEKGKSEKEDEPSVGKADARSGQWVDITIKKGVKYVVVLHMKHLTVLRNTLTPGDQGLPTGNQNPLKSGFTKGTNLVKMFVQDYLKRFVWYLDSGCSRHMTGIKQYLHRYSKESGPKVIFGDDSSGDTKMENLNEVRVKELRSDNGTSGQHQRQECEETVHVTFSEDDEAISQSSTEGDAINFNENRSFPDDESLEPRSEVSITSKDSPEFTEADNHPALHEPDQTESTDHFEPVEPQNNVIINQS
ncbi:hypothetical protein Tco_0558735 [Tanacetum coccineum]